MLEYIQIGGIFMYPIFLLSILALWVILEKIAYFAIFEADATSKFKMKLSKLIMQGNNDEIRDFCKGRKNSLAKATLFTVENIDLSQNNKSELEYVVYESINIELIRLEKRCWILGLCASVSPQLGLLGTVVGMIKSFLGLAATSNAHLVAAGMSESLYTTAAGLLVAIPSLAFHLVFNKKIDGILADLNRLSNLFGRAFQRKCCEICPS